MPLSKPPAARSYRFGSLDGISVVQWIGTPQAAEVDRVIDELASDSSRRGRVRSFVVIVSKTASMPDHAGRLAYLRNVDRTMQLCDRMHIVLDGMPFINAFARGLVTTANIVPRFRGRTFVHDTLGACLVDVSSDVGRTPADLERSILAALA